MKKDLSKILKEKVLPEMQSLTHQINEYPDNISDDDVERKFKEWMDDLDDGTPLKPLSKIEELFYSIQDKIQKIIWEIEYLVTGK